MWPKFIGESRADWRAGISQSSGNSDEKRCVELLTDHPVFGEYTILTTMSPCVIYFLEPICYMNDEKNIALWQWINIFQKANEDKEIAGYLITCVYSHVDLETSTLVRIWRKTTNSIAMSQCSSSNIDYQNKFSALTFATLVYDFLSSFSIYWITSGNILSYFFFCELFERNTRLLQNKWGRIP